MTMIAIQESNNFPLLWGDLLFSTTLSQDSEFIYPSYNINFDLPINGNIYPYRLMQKAYIIHPLIAIVCAGNLARMKRFIICIKDYFNTNEATIENLDLVDCKMKLDT
jgi:elongation factor P hydroxylase